MCICNLYIKIKRYSYKNEGYLDFFFFFIIKVIFLYVNVSVLRLCVIFYFVRVYDSIYLVFVSIFFLVGGLLFVSNDRYICEK